MLCVIFSYPAKNFGKENHYKIDHRQILLVADDLDARYVDLRLAIAEHFSENCDSTSARRDELTVRAQSAIEFAVS